MNTTIIKVSQLIFCQQELIAKPGNAVKAESDLNIQILKFLDDIKDRIVWSRNLKSGVSNSTRSR